MTEPVKAPRVLVIDSNKADLEDLAAKLRRIGCEVETALDVVSALKKIQEGQLDAVFCEQVLRRECDGVLLHMHLVNQEDKLKDRFILMNENMMQLSSRKYAEDNNIPFLLKPIQRDDVALNLEILLERG